MLLIAFKLVGDLLWVADDSDADPAARQPDPGPEVRFDQQVVSQAHVRSDGFVRPNRRVCTTSKRSP